MFSERRDFELRHVIPVSKCAWPSWQASYFAGSQRSKGLLVFVSLADNACWP